MCFVTFMRVNMINVFSLGVCLVFQSETDVISVTTGFIELLQGVSKKGCLAE